MTNKRDCKSDYDQCSTLLLSAYFSLTGQTSLDDRLRKSIEDALTELFRKQYRAEPSNIVSFCGKNRERLWRKPAG